MAEKEYPEQNIDGAYIKTKDLEEKQRILKERLILIGKNLIETKEKIMESILDLKKDLEVLKEDSTKTKLFLENISKEFPKFVKKDDFNILAKQMKMFEPLKYLKKNRK